MISSRIMLLEKLPNAIFKLRNIVVLVCVDANHQLSDKNYIKEGRGRIFIAVEKFNKKLILTILLNKFLIVYSFLRSKQIWWKKLFSW